MYATVGKVQPKLIPCLDLKGNRRAAKMASANALAERDIERVKTADVENAQAKRVVVSKGADGYIFNYGSISNSAHRRIHKWHRTRGSRSVDREHAERCKRRANSRRYILCELEDGLNFISRAPTEHGLSSVLHLLHPASASSAHY
eukprot:IDg1138t1